MKKLAEDLKRTPTKVEIITACKSGACPAVSTLRYMFGGLPNAHKKAGIEYKTSWARVSVISAVTIHYRHLGRHPTIAEIDQRVRAGQGPFW